MNFILNFAINFFEYGQFQWVGRRRANKPNFILGLSMSICDMSYSVHLRNLPFSTFSPQLGQNLSVDERSPPHFKQLLLSSLVPQKLQKFCLSCTGAEQLMQTLKQKVLGMGSHESILPCSQQQFFTTMTSFK